MAATPAEAIARGVDYLLGMRDAGGGWRRSRYGALRGGAALTAFMLRVLSRLSAPANAETPEKAGPTARRDSALAAVLREPLADAVDFLRIGLEKRGAIACPDGTLDLPVYATALALLAESPTRPLWSAVERQRMRDYLFATQVSLRRGFTPTDPHLGGWDLGGVPPPRGITTGTNISLTAWALQALAHSAPDLPRNTPAPRESKGGPARESKGEPASESRDASASESKGASASESKGAPTNAPTNASASAPTGASASAPAGAVDADWRESARQWLGRCQLHPGDGGFVFTPDRGATENKAGVDPATGQPRSYGSASSDGLLALAALKTLAGAASPVRDTASGNTPGKTSGDASGDTSGNTPGKASGKTPGDTAWNAAWDTAWDAALHWFAKFDRWDRTPGGPEAVWFYGAARFVEAAEFFPRERREAIRESIATAVIVRQRADGSWASLEPAMREDDPLIATPLAIAALSGLN
ncbi:MAG: hypothetical protein RLY70_3838 [Planctomycetota bacterium]